MQIVRTAAELRAARAALAGRVGFVPTMGALHAGHARLMEVAKKKADHLIVSIFVNPTQFGPNEDFTKYPRTEEADLALCEATGADIVFLPKATEIYRAEPLIRLAVDPKIAGVLCGAHRPGHFDGVAQVVAILFNLVRPHSACFGEKDYQQLAVLRRLADDLHFGIDIIPVPTVREPDGLALSSRNRYLSPEERAAAPAIYRAMLQCKSRADQIRFDRIAQPVAKVEEEGRALILKEIPGAQIDYFEIRHTDTLEPTQFIMNKSRLFAAVRVGTTRLIDNLLLGG
ncbi:MAG TPA: pantoate--beta-alanine ligase [bacterium]|nr:pantoate--beta-alanine ligase [bacterium]